MVTKEMKKTYMCPSVEVMSISGSDAVMENFLPVSDKTTVDTSEAGVQLGREEEDFTSGPWDSEW